MCLTDEDKEWIASQIASQLTSQLTLATGDLRRELERVETSLLTEFHKWASPLEARMRTHSAALRAIDLEMESISDRVTKLERPQ